MNTQIVLIFCLCYDLLKGLHHIEDQQCQLSDAEVMTAAIVAMLFAATGLRSLRIFDVDLSSWHCLDMLRIDH